MVWFHRTGTGEYICHEKGDQSGEYVSAEREHDLLDVIEDLVHQCHSNKVILIDTSRAEAVLRRDDD